MEECSSCYKEVYFDKFCKKCKNYDVKEHKDPCNECLDYGYTETGFPNCFETNSNGGKS